MKTILLTAAATLMLTVGANAATFQQRSFDARYQHLEVQQSYGERLERSVANNGRRDRDPFGTYAILPSPVSDQ